MENLPGRKPFIICANHISWIDPITVGVAIPVRYKIYYMAKIELFKNPVVGFLLRKVGAFPIKRYDGDYVALKKSFQILKEGKVLGLFPEGSRSKDGRLQKAHDGAALIAVRSGVPILPVAIEGPYKFFKPLRLHIGKPFVLPPLVYENKNEKKEQLEDLSRQIMHNIGRLLPADGN
jgi:1-acyl-sn-glycerol-3-phosphate acyltransferase